MRIGDDYMAPDFKLFNDEWLEKPNLSVEFKVDDTDLSQWLQGEKILNHDDFTIQEDLYNRIIEGDVNMKNEVLNLYYNRKRNEIIDKYDKKENEYFTKNKLVNDFNELVKSFEEDLENLYKSEDNIINDYITESYNENLYKYKINKTKLGNEFEEKYIEKRNKEMLKLREEVKEIEAQLSLSDDLDYQLEVLTRYGILDKKTKKMVD